MASFWNVYVVKFYFSGKFEQPSTKGVLCVNLLMDKGTVTLKRLNGTVLRTLCGSFPAISVVDLHLSDDAIFTVDTSIRSRNAAETCLTEKIRLSFIMSFRRVNSVV